MDGVHDLGGLDGLGPLGEKDDATFHETWEAKVDSMMSVMIAQGYWSAPELRYARARLEPSVYLSSSYDGRKLGALEMLCIEKGLIDAEELFARIDDVGTTARYEDGLPSREDPELTARIRAGQLDKGGELPPQTEPAFEPGAKVRVRNIHPEGHTRCPRYVRRARGTVVEVHPTTELPDASVHGEHRLERLYSVEFDADELWGADHPGNHQVALNLWESYLEEP